MAEAQPNEDSIRKIIHDLNGEIFLVRGNAELTLDQLPADSDSRRGLEQIMERVEEINKIVLRLREKQHLYEGKPK